MKNTQPSSKEPYKLEDIKSVQSHSQAIPRIQRIFPQGTSSLNHATPKLHPPAAADHPFTIMQKSKDGLPMWIKGEVPGLKNQILSSEDQGSAYLEAAKGVLRIDQPAKEFVLLKNETDEQGQLHLLYQQYYKDIKVHAGEVRLHGNSQTISRLNGRYFPTPDLASVEPSLTAEAAIELALQDLSGITSVKPLTETEKHLIPGAQSNAELIIYHKDGNSDQECLAWHIKLIPNITSNWIYFVDAKDGTILKKYDQVCKILGHLHDEVHTHSKVPQEANAISKKMHGSPPPDGPTTANATDLFGMNRLIHVYEKSGIYYMIDASRNMHQAFQSAIPDDPVGTIWTVDAENKAPQNSDFSVSHVATNNNVWNNPVAVSAHHNAAKAYEYFETTFNRLSINGNGGNIISLINVADENGQDMDNAFWNGQAMFYGNGDQAFYAPLAKALDVAGHEMSHGVIQNTANLEYYGEPGALNESFADIFGAMIDRNDWKIGEDVTNSNIYPTGAIRDMSNPHNGGSNLNHAGYQPGHLSEKYTGNQDNAGVHINSGIPNRAYYYYATDIGKDKAEQVFYRALTQYLVKSSQFVDLRLAVMQSAADLYGASSSEVSAAGNAFDAVGIVGDQGGDYQKDVEINPGEEAILLTDVDQSKLYLGATDASNFQELTDEALLSKPSVSDDGSYAVYIAADATMREIDLATREEYVIQDQPIWRNVAISKDGLRLAALTDDNDNKVLVYDYISQNWEEFELYNPTFAEGVATGDVQYADILEWDFDGEFVMYDAFNKISSSFEQDIEYWDVGFVRVWDSGLNTFGDGQVFKLFSGLPEDTSIGNPTFAKNSPYIVAFDYIDNFNDEYYLLSTNIETGDVGTIFQNRIPSVPNFSVKDDLILFDYQDPDGTFYLSTIDVGADKISTSDNLTVLYTYGHWGVWFATGERDYQTSIESFEAAGVNIEVFPNPFEEQISITFTMEKAEKVQIQLTDILGNVLFTKEEALSAGKQNKELNLPQLATGHYFLKLRIGEECGAIKVVKM
ncbi:MAG: T9SS type A sorting domain-containing protein [Bacteroidetes bacterium]|nr:T9SS type A sorting domain-containing protein [Bacteroidota bacterium]